jgi:ABC-type transporter Mla subunit MlaD
MTAKKMTIDEALTGENKFLAQVAEMIEDSVARNVAKTLAPTIKKLDDAASKMSAVVRTVETLTQAEARTSKRVSNMAVDFNRFANWATNRGLREDLLERKLDRIVEVISPELSAELQREDPPDARETPPAPGSTNGGSDHHEG